MYIAKACMAYTIEYYCPKTLQKTTRWTQIASEQNHQWPLDSQNQTLTLHLIVEDFAVKYVHNEDAEQLIIQSETLSNDSS